MVPIHTAKGTFHVWTKRVGNNPTIKVLLLHGGPGATHEYLEALDSYFPKVGIEYYYYDQLGSAYSDQPDEPDLWEIPRFVEEVEQVRQALHLDRTNFYLYGQSWGGILALEYALKYERNLKALIISNMVPSIPAYNRYTADVLMPGMNQKGLVYDELLMKYFYVEHVLRMPPEQWPDPVLRGFNKINRKIYVPMQGPSEMGSSGKLATWDRTSDLPRITVPTLAIGARYDTMDPSQMQKIARKVRNGRYLYCPNGSHLAIYDDQQVYMTGLIQFILDVNSGAFPSHR